MLFNHTANSGYSRLVHLARGGMCDAWLASRSAFDGSPFVVLKQLLPEFVDEPAAQRMLRAEAKLLAPLTHPSIARAYEVAVVDGVLSLPLEFVYGDTLNQLQAQSLRRGTRVPVTVSAHVLQQFASALGYIHDRRVGGVELTHGDISPQNLMISYSGDAKLIDFGVSNAHRARGQILAKPAYSSPEQLLGMASGPASDIYALGIVAWELLVGRRLVSTNHPLDAANTLLNQSIPPLRAFRPDVPVALETLVMSMLESSPSDRITAEGLDEQLSSYLEFHTDLGRVYEDTAAFMRRYAPAKMHTLSGFLSEIAQPSRGLAG